jgi:lysophospholipase L1-like esterase
VVASSSSGELGAAVVASEYSAGDGIHLNDAGHERRFDVALPSIEPYVCANLRCD